MQNNNNNELKKNKVPPHPGTKSDTGEELYEKMNMSEQKASFLFPGVSPLTDISRLARRGTGERHVVPPG